MRVNIILEMGWCKSVIIEITHSTEFGLETKQTWYVQGPVGLKFHQDTKFLMAE